ncbi:MAG: ArsR/SmtB family transcription factor [Acidimicrobiales bacterium]
MSAEGETGPAAASEAARAPSLGRRPATLAEARALSHPSRLRILRLCKDESLTNKELACRMEVSPGTLLHHVRTLVSTGFLQPEAPRPGPRGTTEKPYRSTGKSWWLDLGAPDGSSMNVGAVLAAAAAELDEAGPEALIRMTRAAMRLGPAKLGRLEAQVDGLTEEHGLADDDEGEPVALLVVLHRRPGPSGATT